MKGIVYTQNYTNDEKNNALKTIQMVTYPKLCK